MKNTIEVDTPDSTPEDQVKTVEQRKQGLLDERRARLLGNDKGKEDPEEDEEEIEVETPDASDDSEDDDGPESEEDVHSQLDDIDIDSLSEDDIRAIAKLKGVELDPKADKAWAAQRRKVKELEAELELVKKAKDEALSIRSTNDAETRLTQAETNLKYWNRKLQLSAETQYDEATGNDVKGVTHEGKFYSAEKLVDWLDGEEAKLPELRKEASLAAKARESVGNLDDAIDEVKAKYGLDEKASEAYDKFLSNPKFEVLKNMLPEFSLELIDIFGKAALQTAGSSKKSVVIKRKAPKESRESISPVGGSGRPNDSGGKSAKIKQLEKIASDNKLSPKQRGQALRDIRQLKYS
jgi:hypothetical protein